MDININFDEASNEWNKNKIKLGKGYYKYKCKIECCNECIYSYVTSNKLFKKIATDFDILNQNHKNKNIYCEDHLLCED